MVLVLKYGQTILLLLSFLTHSLKSNSCQFKLAGFVDFFNLWSMFPQVDLFVNYWSLWPSKHCFVEFMFIIIIHIVEICLAHMWFSLQNCGQMDRWTTMGLNVQFVGLRTVKEHCTSVLRYWCIFPSTLDVFCSMPRILFRFLMSENFLPILTIYGGN